MESALPKFSKRSRKALDTCDAKLILLFEEVVKHYDCSVLCGYRDKEEQDRLYHEGRSKLFYPNSKHNTLPSRAVDVVSCPVSWSNMDQFYHFSGYVLGVAASLGIKIRSGLDWDNDRVLNDQTFMDGPHFELIE